MWTINYKGFFIQGYCDKPECKVTGWSGGAFKSLHAAKIAITRKLLPSHNAAMVEVFK